MRRHLVFFCFLEDFLLSKLFGSARLPSPTHSQPANSQRWLPDANGYGLARFPACTDAVVKAAVIADHGDFGQ